MASAFAILGFIIAFAKDIVGLDVSIHQLIAVEQRPPVIVTTLLKPICPVMTGTASSEILNKIELSRIKGACR